MAIWAGSTYNNTNIASMTNQVWGAKAYDVVRNQNAFLYAILGKRWLDTNGAGGTRVNFERLHRITGYQVKTRFLGVLNTIATVADGSAELATATRVWANNYFGAAVFDLTHYAQTDAIPSNEWNRIKGKEAETSNFLAERMDQIMLSFERTLGTAINATVNTGFTRTVMGNIRHACSDGVTTGETTYATYGTLDRSDSANVDFRGKVTGSTGILSLEKIQTHRNTISDAYKRPDIGLGDITTITEIQGLLNGFTVIESDDEWKKFAGDYVQIGSTRYLMDGLCAANILYHINSDTFGIWENEMGLSTDGWMRDPNAVAGYIMPWEYWCGIFCNRPKGNGILTGITF